MVAPQTPPPGRAGSAVARALVLLATVAALGSTPLAEQQAAVVRLVSTPWSPFTNVPGQPRLALDFVHDALKRVGVTADTTIVPDGELTSALRQRRFDGSAALWRDAEREAFLIYSAPYLHNRLILVGARGADVTATRFAQLAGRRIALVEGFSYGEIPAAPAGPSVVRTRSVEESLEQVLARNADYALLDELVLQYLVEHFPRQVSERLALGTTPLVVRSLHLALRRDLPGAQAMIDRFNVELRSMVADRSYHRLLQVAWIEADVDGDGRPESVPATDEAGAVPPTRQYSILSSAQTLTLADTERRFFIGGQVYDRWGAVPDRYKVGDPTKTPWGSTVAPIFTLKW